MDIEELLKATKASVNNKVAQPSEPTETTGDLLDQLQLEIPKDPRIERLKKHRDMLNDADYWQIHKMIQTFDLSDDELTEELERYGIYEEI